ncbi:MAG: gamma-glutamyltransferase, partial [Azospirillaceae bacterium]
MCRVGGMVTAALAIASCQVTGGGREVALQRTMIAGDEPVAVRTARSVLDEGGNAVDAAVAAGFALAVTLPSRAGLGGGGACLVHDAEAETVRGIVFTPSTGDGAALPGLARGLFAVHALGGRLRWERLVRPAEMLARFGVGVPRALAADISAAEAAGRLPDAFRGPDGAPLAEGATMVRPELAQSLSMIRSSGAGAIHRGPLATAYAAGATAAGVPIDPAALGDAVAATFEPAARDAGNDRLYVATPEAAAGPLQG